MNISNRTALITGGGSGIGFEIAKLLSNNGNAVILTGRNESKLKDAAKQLKGADIFVADVTQKEDLEKLVSYLYKKYPELDILINNAGLMFDYDLSKDTGIYDKARAEIITNYSSVVYLTEKLLPGLKAQSEAAIVNVTSILALSPAAGVSTYSASKAALRSFTLSLRFALAKSTNVKVFELLPPLVDTDLSKNVGGTGGIPASAVASDLLNGLKNDIFEVAVGQTSDFRDNFFPAANTAFDMLNKPGGSLAE